MLTKISTKDKKAWLKQVNELAEVLAEGCDQENFSDAYIADYAARIVAGAFELLEKAGRDASVGE